MSGLLDAVEAAIDPLVVTTERRKEYARAAAMAVADWLALPRGGRPSPYAAAVTAIRTEVNDPPPPTPDDAVLRAIAGQLLGMLRDAGMLREGTP